MLVRRWILFSALMHCTSPVRVYSVLAPPHQCAVVVLDRVLVHASVFKYL